MEKRNEMPQETMLGRIIDLPMKDFEEELVKQKINIGTMNNLILNLESAYNELRVRKDAILDAKLRGSVEIVKAETAVRGIYAEMIKIEQKVVFLKNKVKDLVDVDKKH